MAPTWRGAALLPLLLMAIVASIHAGPVPVRRPRFIITDGGRENAKPQVEASANITDIIVCKYENETYVEGNEIETPNKCESCQCGPEGAMVCVPRCRQMVEPMSSGECYKDNKTYSNGQKIHVDPSGSGSVSSGSDPCKVCYCVKGEVVCSPLACYQRDDCEPRFVPGRCCPEYDHCPLKDTTDVEKSSNSKEISDLSADKNFAAKESHTRDQSKTSDEAKGETKKVITIKEVTPVSEIPSIGGIKIKEILPPAIEVHDFDYVSTKAPLKQREVPFTQAFSEKTTQTSIQPDTNTRSDNIITTTAPPIIKIGDATVITVIGAEGLERGGEEEDSTDSKVDTAKTAKPTTSHSEVTENDDRIGATSNIVLEHSNLSDELAEVMRELHATTTITPDISFDVLPSSMETHTPHVTESENLGKDSQHEHINQEDEMANRDHNIEFPPIPDDITIHHQDESMELSETPALIVEKVETSSDKAKVTINHKRPVFSLASYQEPKKEDNKVHDIINAGKTLINLHAIKHNDTDVTNDINKVMSADWLKSSVEVSTDENTLPDTSIESSIKDSPLLNLNSELPQDILNENSSIKDTDFDHGEFTTMKAEVLKKLNIVDNPTNIVGITPTTMGESTEFAISTSIANDDFDSDVSLNIETESTTSIALSDHDSNSATKDEDVKDELSTTSIYKVPTESSSMKNINTPTVKTYPKKNLSIPDSKETITPSQDNSEPKKYLADVLIEVKKSDLALQDMFRTTENNQAYQRNLYKNDSNLDLISVTLTSVTESDHRTENNISDELTETNEFLTVKPNKDRTNAISDLINLVGDVVSIGDTPESAKDSYGENAKLINGGHLYSGELLPVSNTVEHESKDIESSATSSPSDDVLLNNDIALESQQESSNNENVKTELELNDELDIDGQTDTTEGNENIEHTTKSVIIDRLTDSQINNMSSIEHKDIELLSNITLNKNTGPTKVIKQIDEEPMSTDEPQTTPGLDTAENTSTITSTTHNDKETGIEDINDDKQQTDDNYNVITSTEPSVTDSIATN